MSVFTTITRRPVAVITIFIVLVVFSVITLLNIPIDFQPNVEFNFASVVTNYDGASADLVEQTITIPLERAISSIDNIEKINSRTSEGTCIIELTFKFKSGMDNNLNNLRSALDRVANVLPSGASAPTVFTFDASVSPVINLAIGANRNHNQVREYVDDVLLPYFEQIEGVSSVFVNGGAKKSMYVDVSLNRLNAYNLTLTEVKNAIQRNSFQGTIGEITTAYQDVDIVLEGAYESIDEVRNIVVKQSRERDQSNVSIRLRDIADVDFASDSAIQTYRNDQPVVTVLFFKQTDANLLKVSDAIKKELLRINAISPDDFSFVVLRDYSDYIRRIFDVVTDTALFGGILALLVLILFLRNIASVFSIGLSIPISIMLTVMLMDAFGYTLNFMTLIGLAMGLGIIVDNSIVVLENIYIKRKNKINLIPAAEYGTAEMAAPVFASTATTVLVFAPLLLFERELGLIGSYFTNLGFAVVVAVLISYFTAIFLMPVLTSKFIPLNPNKSRGVIGSLNRVFDGGTMAFENGYRGMLEYMVRRKKRFMLLIIVLAILPLTIFPRLGFQQLPDFVQNGISIDITFPVGTQNEEMFAVGTRFQQDSTPYLPEVEHALLTVYGPGASASLFYSLNTVTIDYYFTEFQNNDTFLTLKAQLTDIAKLYPYAIKVQAPFAGGGRGGQGGPYQLKVRSGDLDKLRQAAESFQNTLRAVPGIYNFDSNLPSSSLGIALEIDRDRANTLGLTVSGVKEELDLAVSETRTSTYVEDSREYNIMLRLQEQDSSRIDVLDQLFIRTPTARVPLADFVDKKLASSEFSILRENGIKTVTIYADIRFGADLNEVIAQSRSLLSENPFALDDDVTFFFAGEFESRQENFRIMIYIFILAVVFVFGVMASQFESVSDPFIIIFTIPLTFSGVALIYWLTDTGLTMFSLAGIVILIGISVNHGIVLVDYINMLRRRGLPLVEAVAEGARARLQPILMTTFTTIGGMLPLAFSRQAGLELVQPIAVTIVGGLATSALLSLFFVPLLYSGFHALRERGKQRKVQKLKQRRERHEEEILNAGNVVQGGDYETS